MTPYVVDASVSLKWYVPEVHDDAAKRLLEPGFLLQAPDLFLSEVGNILWKKVQRGQLAAEDAGLIHSTIRTSSGVQLHPAGPVSDRAMRIAIETGRTFYDSLYVALAEALSCPLVTADEKLYNALRAGSLGHAIRWVTDPL